MANRRMFSKKITDTDFFLSMPLSSQALYFHLNMGADDEGFIDKAKTIQRIIGAGDDDMKLLIAKGFILPFESGVVVIRHWRIHNYIQSDRFQPTIHQHEKKMIDVDVNKTFNIKPNGQCIQNVDKTDTQVRLGKDRLELEIDKHNVGQSPLSGQGPEFAFPVWLSSQSVEILKTCKANNIELYIPIQYLNQKAGSKYKFIDRNARLVKARFKDGFTLEDFKSVIDKKVSEWGPSPEWSKYLRPETLFGNKFEGYLNQTTTQVVKETNVPSWANEPYRTEATPEELAEMQALKREMLGED